MSVLVKSAIRSSLKNKIEFIAIVALVVFSLSLYATASITYTSTDSLFKSYLTKSYGDVLIVGYIPKDFDLIAAHMKSLKDHTGFAVVPAYGVLKNGKTVPLLLGYSEAAYRNNTMLGGFKAKPLKEGQALLLRQGAIFLHPGEKLSVYLSISINPITKPFNLTIVGYAEGGLPLPAGPVVFLSKPDGERLLEEFGGYTVYSFILKNPSQADTFIKKVTKVIKEIGGYVGFVYNTRKDLLFYPGQTVILESSNALKFISMVSWIVASIVVVAIAAIYIERNIREIASLRVVGTSWLDLAKYLTILWGTRLYVGLVLSIIVGYVIATYSIHTVLSHPRLQPLLNFLHIVIPSSCILFLFGITTITLTLSVLISLIVIKKLRMTETLYFYGLKLRIKEESSLPFSLMLAASELRSVLWRSLAAILIISITIGLLVLPYSLGASLEKVSIPKGFDVKVTFLIIPRISPSIDFAINMLSKELSNTKASSLWLENLYGSVGMRAELITHNKDVPVYVHSCLMQFKGSCWEAMPKLLAGKWPSKANELAISLYTSNLLHLKIGDVVKVKRIILGRTYIDKLKIVGIYDSTTFPPSVVLPKELVPSIHSLKVFVVRIITKNSEKVALSIQNDLISSGYAAVSLTWKAYINEVYNSLKYIAKSIRDTILSSFAVVTLSITAFALSDVSTRKKILALLKAIGLTSLDYFTAVLSKWYVLALVSLPITSLLSYSIAKIGISILSQVYLIQELYMPKWFIILIFIIPLYISLIVALYFKAMGYTEELKTT